MGRLSFDLPVNPFGARYVVCLIWLRDRAKATPRESNKRLNKIHKSWTISGITTHHMNHQPRKYPKSHLVAKVFLLCKNGSVSRNPGAPKSPVPVWNPTISFQKKFWSFRDLRHSLSQMHKGVYLSLPTNFIMNNLQVKYTNCNNYQ